MTEVTCHAHISFFRLQKPLNSNTVGTCVFVAQSQKNSMEFSRQSERQKSLCQPHTTWHVNELEAVVLNSRWTSP